VLTFGCWCFLLCLALKDLHPFRLRPLSLFLPLHQSNIDPDPQTYHQRQPKSWLSTIQPNISSVPSYPDPDPDSDLLDRALIPDPVFLTLVTRLAESVFTVSDLVLNKFINIIKPRRSAARFSSSLLSTSPPGPPHHHPPGSTSKRRTQPPKAQPRPQTQPFPHTGSCLGAKQAGCNWPRVCDCSQTTQDTIGKTGLG